MQLSDLINNDWRKTGQQTTWLNLGSSVVATMACGGLGAFSQARQSQPKNRLVLFAKENCPYSRVLREALTYLDLDYTYVPCVDGATDNREKVKNLIGTIKVPVVVDSEHEHILDESEDIKNYLFRTYGTGEPPWFFDLTRVNQRFSKFASQLRASASHDDHVISQEDDSFFELWDFEALPTGRIVRERLDALGITHIRHNTAPGGHRWRRNIDQAKRLQPVLKVSDESQRIVGAANILKYLDQFS